MAYVCVACLSTNIGSGGPTLVCRDCGEEFTEHEPRRRATPKSKPARKSSTDKDTPAA